MTIVINILAGSGCGKSTLAAGLFAQMKMQGYHVELVTEYVKTWAWTGRRPTAFDQVYLFGKQAQSESRLYGKVDYIITDSPLLLSGFYEDYHLNRELTLPAIKNFLQFASEEGIKHLNFFLERNKPFDSRGRFETAEQAKKIDGLMREWFLNQNISYVDVKVADDQRVEFLTNFLKNSNELSKDQI